MSFDAWHQLCAKATRDGYSRVAQCRQAASPVCSSLPPLACTSCSATFALQGCSIEGKMYMQMPIPVPLPTPYRLLLLLPPPLPLPPPLLQPLLLPPLPLLLLLFPSLLLLPLLLLLMTIATVAPSLRL